MITNRHGLPQALVNALQKADADYDGGGSDLTVSSLHEPPRIRILKQKHRGEIESDISERVNSLLGTAFHHIAEVSAPNGHIVEKRFSIMVDGWVVSGKPDVYDPEKKEINDWKVLSVWGVMIGDAIAEYTKKQNTYAHILRANGMPVESLKLTVLFRDWQAREARRNQDYPQKQVIEYELDLWSEADAEAHVTSHVHLHQQAQIAFDKHGELVGCNDADKWAKPTTYAVKKPGNQRALRVFQSQSEAAEFSGSSSQQTIIETRPGEWTRCMFFCPVRGQCEVGKSLEMAAEAAF